MFNGSWSLRRVLNEVLKCVVLCANCHSKVHWEERVVSRASE